MMSIELKNKEWIFLDLDNTLWDFEGNAEKSLIALYETYGIHFHTGVSAEKFVKIYKEINAKYWHLYEQKKVDKETLRTKRFTDAFHQIGLDETLHPKTIADEYLEVTARMPGMIEGANEALQALYGKYKLALITNGFQQTQEWKIAASGISSYIEFMVTSETIGATKPHKEIFQFALEKARVSSDKALFVGDHWEADVWGPMNAGIDAIWFNRAREARGIELPESALFIKESVQHQDWLELM